MVPWRPLSKTMFSMFLLGLWLLIIGSVSTMNVHMSHLFVQPSMCSRKVLERSHAHQTYCVASSLCWIDDVTSYLLV